MLKHGFIAKLRQALTPCEDQWSWGTLDGRDFEDAEVAAIEADSVVFQHRFGKLRIPVTGLSEASQKRHRRILQTTPALAHVAELNVVEAPTFTVETGKPAEVPSVAKKGFQAAA